MQLPEGSNAHNKNKIKAHLSISFPKRQLSSSHTTLLLRHTYMRRKEFFEGALGFWKFRMWSLLRRRYSKNGTVQTTPVKFGALPFKPRTAERGWSCQSRSSSSSIDSSRQATASSSASGGWRHAHFDHTQEGMMEAGPNVTLSKDIVLKDLPCEIYIYMFAFDKCIKSKHIYECIYINYGRFSIWIIIIQVLI